MPASAVVSISTRWSDFDALGHVNNAVYLTYGEVGRDQMFREIIGDAFLDLVIAHLEIDFRREIALGVEEVTVTSRLVSLGRTSVRTEEQILLPGGDVAATITTVVVARDEQTRSSRAWSDAEREALEAAIG